ncbi:MAG: CBS domain-containing protein [Nitratireductor sp.]|nr:CBS domain-containing protein [Nitratireductor sp.]
MTVASILTDKGREVVTAGTDTSLSAIVETLSERKIGAIVVTDEDGKVCGIISERDVVREIAERGVETLDQPVSTCMTRKVVSCGENDTINHVMTLMTRHRFRHLPVVSGGRLTGIISIGDVVKRRMEQIERDAEELRNYIATA